MCACMSFPACMVIKVLWLVVVRLCVCVCISFLASAYCMVMKALWLIVVLVRVGLDPGLILSVPEIIVHAKTRHHREFTFLTTIKGAELEHHVADARIRFYCIKV